MIFSIDNMALLEKTLMVKQSTIPGSGKGLFTRKPIPKGTAIVEYKGKITDWKCANHDGGNNAYIFYVNRNYVIDALNRLNALARYANDGLGLKRVKGISNNSVYITQGKKVFIKSVKDIPAGSEVLVDYGRDYWKVIKKNSAANNKEDV
jgi:SET domain-containing protein